MVDVVLDAELHLDHLADQRQRPQLALEPARTRPGEHLLAQLVPVFFPELDPAAAARLELERPDPLGTRQLVPLVHRVGAHAQIGGDRRDRLPRMRR